MSTNVAHMPTRLSERIARRARGLLAESQATQAQLAARLDMSPPTF